MHSAIECKQWCDEHCCCRFNSIIKTNQLSVILIFTFSAGDIYIYHISSLFTKIKIKGVDKGDDMKITRYSLINLWRSSSNTGQIYEQ